MNILISTLKEELKTALRLEKRYLKDLQKLPKGCFIVRKKNDNRYGYITRRNGEKIVQEYLGKMDDKKIEHYQQLMMQRKNYQKKLKSIRKKFSILRKALRGKTTQARH